jgi:hypothetical protein
MRCHGVRKLAPAFGLLLTTAFSVGLFANSRQPMAPPPAAMTDAEFTKLLSAVRPCAGEDDFDKIPWLISVWDAREKAAKEGKPILLWEMDGHPLGCG